MKHQIKVWTGKDVSLLKKLYPQSATKSVAEVLERTLSSVKSKAGEMGLKKTDFTKGGTCFGTINLIHKERIVRRVRMQCSTDLQKAIVNWYRDIQPAIRRGDKLTLEIEIDKRA